jgi:16S rRNA (adenine1518-N6/adenine1519-N6)-dimethyltransferase
VRPKRRLGQHFLTDPSILNRIVDALDPEPSDTVLEIGPGRGALTAILAERAGTVVAIERDHDLVTGLQQSFPGIDLVAGDALALDWHDVVGHSDFLVIGNIPYNITSPLLDKALTPPRPRRCVFLVQREVGDRIVARPGNKTYGALSVGIQAVARAEVVFRVPAGAFQPPPKVDSAVLRLTPLDVPLVDDAGLSVFRAAVTGLFSLRRKQLLRGIRQLTGWSADEAGAVLRSVGLDPTARPETVTPPAFVALTAALVDLGWSSD